MAYEWKQHPSLPGWTFDEFLAALHLLTTARFKRARDARRAEDSGMSALKKALG